MAPTVFDELAEKIGPLIAKQETRCDVISASERLAVTLRYV